MTDGLLTDHTRTTRRCAVVVVALVAGLAAVNWVLDPDHALRWLRAMVLLPLCWGGLSVWHAWTQRSLLRRGVDDQPAVRAYFTTALALFIVFGLFLAVELGLRLWVRATDPADLDIERRVLGVALAAVLIVVGNGLPKILTPLSMLPAGTSGRLSAARRFIGLVWFVCGLTLALGFVFAPLTLAHELRRWILIVCGVAMLAGIVWMNLRPAEEERYR